MKILITGGAGFIGSNFTRYFVKKYPEYKIVVYDKLTYAGNLDNLKDLESHKNYNFIKGDVCDLDFLIEIVKETDAIIHFAAESHVDNSIGNSLIFTMSNAYGTHALLEAARQSKNIKKIIHVSTDEVYGEILKDKSKEDDKLDPTNPYSASKAAAEMIVQSYIRTYKLPVMITRANNVYGPYQYPEKIIPKFVTNLILGKKVPLHGRGNNVRTYIHTEDFCNAMDIIFHKGKIGETYNIGTENDVSNIELTKKILKIMNKSEDLIGFIADRPFNDMRYSIDSSKLENLGWKPKVPFEKGLKDTINWYQENEWWWMKILRKRFKNENWYDTPQENG